jgi:phosphate starvation-inducible membrane PsiE
MREKIQKISNKICDFLELIISIIVIIALVISAISYLPVIKELFVKTGNSEEFLIFLEQIFNYVVGIEFIKLLCKPNTENTFEVLIFLVSRHMIIGHNSALDMFLSVASIAILCVIRRLLNTKFKIEKKNDEKLEKIS